VAITAISWNSYAAISVIDALASVPGVGRVRLMSGGEYAMRIWVRPDRLATLGITVSDIVNAVKQQNVLTPAGQVEARRLLRASSPTPCGPPTGWPRPSSSARS
jgi:multidrug efflux pump subunit AcrB